LILYKNGIIGEKMALITFEMVTKLINHIRDLYETLTEVGILEL